MMNKVAANAELTAMAQKADLLRDRLERFILDDSVNANDSEIMRNISSAIFNITLELLKLRK